MRKKNRAFPLLLAAALLLSLCSGLSLAFAVDLAPLKLTASLDGQGATVAVVTTEEITCSNYDVKLSWNSTAFTLSSITNGQSSLFTNFQSNAKPGDPNAGKISAASGGENVTVAAGQTLATYSFTVADGAAAGSYDFTLTVRDVADENGDALGWKGADLGGSVEIVSGGSETPDPSVPLKLACQSNGAAVEVSVVTTEAITLSNYDVKLSWNSAVFTLNSIANGQSSLFTNFQSNAKPGDPNAGKISAASGGENVTVTAGQTLATYSFTVADGAAAGSYDFTLTVRDVADENGDALSWKGVDVGGSVVLAEKPASEIRRVQVTSTIATVTLANGESGQTLYLASYTAAGQMLEVFAQSVETGVSEYTFTLTQPGGYVKAFLTDADAKPLCETVSSK